jgi:hypothetical protein
MSGKVPKDVRDRVTAMLWSRADDIDWARLPDTSRAEWYENWSKDPSVGGVLGNFMDPRLVRVYIKDSLLKPYIRHRTGAAEAQVLGVVGISCAETVLRTYVKPHGRLLDDGRVTCWGNSRDWKSILISVYERAKAERTGRAFGAVLIESGPTHDPNIRALVSDVARRLDIEQLKWLD